MTKFKNLVTGIVEVVENAEVIALMESSDSYEEVIERTEKPVEAKKPVEAEKEEK